MTRLFLCVVFLLFPTIPPYVTAALPFSVTRYQIAASVMAQMKIRWPTFSFYGNPSGLVFTGRVHELEGGHSVRQHTAIKPIQVHVLHCLQREVRFHHRKGPNSPKKERFIYLKPSLSLTSFQILH